MKIGRNDPCHCGSGQKYKKCCLSKDDAAHGAELAARAAARAAEAEASQVEQRSPPLSSPKQGQRSLPGMTPKPKALTRPGSSLIRKRGAI